jgi:hypothetical protein
MATALWMNIPLMVLAFGLITGIPLWLIRHRDWHHKPEAREVPAYLEHRPALVRAGMVRVSRTTGYAGRRPMRPATGSANG